jgi:hypothetical protein
VTVFGVYTIPNLGHMPVVVKGAYALRLEIDVEQGKSEDDLAQSL